MGDTRERPPTAHQILTRTAAARAALEQQLSGLTPEQLAAPAAADGWAVKDYLAHLAVWADGIAALLEHKPRWETMGLDLETVLNGDYDAINAILYAHFRELSPAEAWARFDAADTRVRAAIAAVGDAGLRRSYAYYQPGEIDDSDAPIAGWVAGNTYEHYDEHRAWLAELLQQNGWA